MSLKSHQSGADYQTTISLPPLPCSLVMWFKPSTATPAGNVVLMTLYDPTAVKYLRIDWKTNNVMQAVVFDGALNLASGASTNVGSWNNIIANFAGTGVTGTGVDIYVNNVKSSSTFSYTWSTSSARKFYLFGIAETNTLGASDTNAVCSYGAVYTTTMSDASATSLQTLYPSVVQTANLPHRWDMTETPPTDQVASTVSWTLGLNGAAATVDNADIPSLSSSAGGIITKVRSFRTMQMGD